MARYQIPNGYTWQTRVASYDVGADRGLRLSNQLKLQQEAGERHFGAAGLTIEEMADLGMAFVLTRTNSRIYRAPRLGEDVALTTWQLRVAGAQFFRAYRFAAADGTPLIDAVSAFALVDTKEHRLLRPSALMDRVDTESEGEPSPCPEPGKWRLPDTMVDAGERKCRYSDIDWNGHVNNTVYADMLCDFVPGGMRGRRVTGFSVQFLREAREGDTLHMQATLLPSPSGGEAFVAGEHDRGRCFEARLQFEKELV